MVRLFLASHGHLASGMKSSLNILLGNSNRINVFDAYIDESSVQDKLNAFFESVSSDDQVILLSDLYGGSVNQAMYTYLERPNTKLIAGVNLALVLELAIKENDLSDDELEQLVNSSREMLQLVKFDSSENSEEEDFF